MRLTLSNDRKVVSLSMQREEAIHPGVKILAWHSKNLKPIKLPYTFKKNIDHCHGKVLDAKFVGKDN
jgi:hypothetical protein